MQPRDNRNNRGADRSADSQWLEEVISIDRVARVVKGGRRFRFRALVAVGDGKRQVGIGVSKGADVQAAITKAVAVAKKSLIKIPIKQGTIPHETTVRFRGAIVMLKPASPGTGVIAGGTVRSVLDVSGIANILSKSLGSNNKINNAYATIKALESLVPRDEWVTTKIATKSVAQPKAKAKSSSAKPAVKPKVSPAKATSKRGKSK